MSLLPQQRSAVAAVAIVVVAAIIAVVAIIALAIFDVRYMLLWLSVLWRLFLNAVAIIAFA